MAPEVDHTGVSFCFLEQVIQTKLLRIFHFHGVHTHFLCALAEERPGAGSPAHIGQLRVRRNSALFHQVPM